MLSREAYNNDEYEYECNNDEHDNDEYNYDEYDKEKPRGIR